MGIMKRNTALRLAIDALQKEYNHWLFVTDTAAGDKRREEIAKAIVVLDNMRRQKEMNL